jgi:hypothetical protein
LLKEAIVRKAAIFERARTKNPETMNYQILLGSSKIAGKFGGILGMPTSMLFSRDGKKVKTITGRVGHDDLAKAIEGQL